jgi:hypothetical protein
MRKTAFAVQFAAKRYFDFSSAFLSNAALSAYGGLSVLVSGLFAGALIQGPLLRMIDA